MLQDAFSKHEKSLAKGGRCIAISLLSCFSQLHVRKMDYRTATKGSIERNRTLVVLPLVRALLEMAD